MFHDAGIRFPLRRGSCCQWSGKLILKRPFHSSATSESNSALFIFQFKRICPVLGLHQAFTESILLSLPRRLRCTFDLVSNRIEKSVVYGKCKMIKARDFRKRIYAMAYCRIFRMSVIQARFGLSSPKSGQESNWIRTRRFALFRLEESLDMTWQDLGEISVRISDNKKTAKAFLWIFCFPSPINLWRDGSSDDTFEIITLFYNLHEFILLLITSFD